MQMFFVGVLVGLRPLLHPIERVVAPVILVCELVAMAGVIFFPSATAVLLICNTIGPVLGLMWDNLEKFCIIYAMCADVNIHDKVVEVDNPVHEDGDEDGEDKVVTENPLKPAAEGAEGAAAKGAEVPGDSTE